MRKKVEADYSTIGCLAAHAVSQIIGRNPNKNIIIATHNLNRKPR
jgi:hypothetical protein